VTFGDHSVETWPGRNGNVEGEHFSNCQASDITLLWIHSGKCLQSR
jgi:hypothetical protein